MKWTDINAIAIALEETRPEADIIHLRFTDLRQWVMALPGFTGDVNGCNEKILEAIQQAWIDERD